MEETASRGGNSTKLLKLQNRLEIRHETLEGTSADHEIKEFPFLTEVRILYGKDKLYLYRLHQYNISNFKLISNLCFIFI